MQSSVEQQTSQLLWGVFSLFASLFLLTLRNNKNIPKIVVGSLCSVAMEA